MIADLKGKLKLGLNLEKKKMKKDNKAKDKVDERSTRERGNRKKKNKMDTSNKENQKERQVLGKDTPQGRQSQREDCQGKDLPLMQAPHGLGHPPSQVLLP
jgi:hypothetical protein